MFGEQRTRIFDPQILILESLMRMSSLPIVLCLLIGCQRNADSDGTSKIPPATTDPTRLAAPVSGSIMGKPFLPDHVYLTETRLEFRKGNEFSDPRIAITLPKQSDMPLEGTEWKFDEVG